MKIRTRYDGEWSALPTDPKLFSFPGGERHASLTEVTRGVDGIKIECVLKSSDDVMDLLLVTDAARRLYPEADLHLLCPYFPGARQDRVANPGECLTASVMAGLINGLRFKTVECWDLHSDVSRSLIHNLIEAPASHFVSLFMEDRPELADAVFVSPDAGATKRVKASAGTRQIIQCSKLRDAATGQITGTHVDDYGGATRFLIVDDICDGGRTFIEIAKAIRAKTRAWIGLYVTHGIFSAGLEPLREHLDHIYTPNPFRFDDVPDFITTLRG